MANMPKRVKHRKMFRDCGKFKKKATRGNFVAYGDYGLQAMEGGWLGAKQIETGRIAAQHFLRRQGKIFIRVFPDKPVSKKPLETRMGKGKADTDYWAAVVKPGTILFEIAGVEKEVTKQAMARIAHKMPFKCRLVERRHNV
ncbi:MAG: 50S ribosomal protein L16 [Planctomycetota bacterium]|jgi:large subunit ribosomal protein L16